MHDVTMMRGWITAICAVAVLAMGGAWAAPTPPVSVASERVTAQRWMYPVGGSAADISDWFVAPAHQFGAGHRGIDLVSAPGEPVIAPVSGIIRFAGVVVDRPVLTVETSSGLLLSLEPVHTTSSVGDVVGMGVVIGTVAEGGHCGESCVHLGVREHGDYVNPMRFLAAKPQLLPIAGCMQVSCDR